jgi:hypothetical protein
MLACQEDVSCQQPDSLQPNTLTATIVAKPKGVRGGRLVFPLRLWKQSNL